MKMKQLLLSLTFLSALLLSACNQPAQSSVEESSNAPETSSEVVPSSSAASSSSSSSKASSSSSKATSSSLPPASYSKKEKEELPQPDNDFHNELQWQYLCDDWTAIKTYIPTTSASGKSLGDKSQPRALELSFDDVADAETYYVQISKTNDFTNAPVLTSTKKSYDFYNGELGQKYYYRAAISEDALATAVAKEYTINDVAPRVMKVDGVINFRDCGGWKSSLVPNGVVKQGMYYRCAQFNSIKAAGKQTIKDLGIKVDIDMRDSYNVPSKSPISTTDWPVEIMKASVASSTEDGRWEGTHSRDTNIAATYKKIFEAIAVADEKPIALHCTHGADRTGIVSFFLLALLGVSKEDCGRDYSFTRFAGERDVDYTVEFNNWVRKTEALEGATFAEKTYKHLNEDFKIEKDTLETIREKFVPGYTRAA